MTTVRTEVDSMGKIEVQADRYWGAQTERSIQNFPISQTRFSRSFIRACGLVKKAAAIVNHDLGKLDADKLQWISQAADEVIAGKLDDHFPLVVYQTGSGTQTNMNINEVIANKAIELAGGELGSKTPVHPNDDVNKSQSSNDSFPTFMHVALVDDVKSQLLPVLQKTRKTLEAFESKFSDAVKTGRTHMMDATPLTLGQEFSAFRFQIEQAEKFVTEGVDALYDLALGGSAVGTGLNTHPEYADRVAKAIAKLSGEPFRSCPNKFQALASHDAVAKLSAALRNTATVCFKLANDIRVLASGPRCSIGEITIPANEPGSSIMPGKVNPTQCEALTMACLRVMGNDVTVGMANSQGHLQLNVFKPLMVHCVQESIEILSDALSSFHDRCLAGIAVNSNRMQHFLDASLMLVTSLNQHIGYDKAAQIAKKAYQEEKTLKEVALELGYVSESEFDEIVQPRKMIQP